MSKTAIFLLFGITLYAQNYNELLNIAIDNSANLEIRNNNSQKAILEGDITTRLQNPNVEFEVSDFSGTKNEFGSRVGVSQSILLPSIKKDKKRLATLNYNVSQKDYEAKRAEFVYRFSMLYLNYKEAIAKKRLQQEEINIAKDITDIASQRYQYGAITQSEFLQTEVDYTNSINRAKELELTTQQRLNSILKFANIDEDITIDTNHIFTISQDSSEHPAIELAQQKQKVSEAKLHLANHTIESVELFSEIEKEPDQDVFRVGISIPIPIFNKKNEEKQLAKIELANQDIFISNQRKNIDITISGLEKEIAIFEDMRNQYQNVISKQERLLANYQEGYKIAKINLLKLNDIKSKLISTKEKIIESNIQIERNSIKINYLKGAYNAK